MELLVATLAQTPMGRDNEVIERIRLINETVRNAPGFISSHIYRGRGSNMYYVLLTTWDDKESWRKSQERYNPKNLLLANPELLLTTPKQWLMHYLWGFIHPNAQATLGAIHMATLQPERVEQIQQGWMQGLRQQSLQSTLAFAFLARGIDDDATIPRRVLKPGEGSSYLQSGSILLNFLSWASDIERDGFYEEPIYKAIHTSIERTGALRILPLEKL
jgi:heme-degrading monooxygenase HmoA